ncbi:MAG: RHS repeat-associated core domain-containing protein [Candidatus Altimarinota bacterium]
MKKIIQLLLIFAFLLFGFGNAYAATILSVSNGGNWNNTSTWVGGIIPGINDDVIVNGTVVSASTSVNNVTINSGSLLRIGNTTNIYGNVVNYGTLTSNGPSVNIYGNIVNYSLIYNEFSSSSLYAYGNIENNGTWNIYNTYLRGANSIKQIIAYQPIGGFIILGDNLEITGIPNFNKEFQFNGKNLTLNNTLSTYKLSGNGTILGNGGEIIIGNSYAGTMTGSLDTLRFSSGATTLNGTLNTKKVIIENGSTLQILNTSHIYGNVINSGILTSNGIPLNIYGNFKNNSIVKNGTTSFSAYIYGNIENNGSWINSSNYLKWNVLPGSGNYNISFIGLSGSSISTNQYLLNNSVLNSSHNVFWNVTRNNNSTSTKCINVPGCILSNGDSAPITPPIVKYNNPPAYNQNPITAQNTNASPTLLSNSTSYYTGGRAQNMSYATEDTSAGDPVILSTGEFDYDNTLMTYQSEGFPFEWKIRYRNQTYYNGPIGNNFDFNYNIYLTEDEDGNINYHDGKLGAFQFEKTSTGFAYQNTLNATLTQSGLTYTINFDSQKKYSFGLNSKIQSLQDAFGNEMTFDYNDDRELTKITDTLGREYILSYYEHSRVQEITDFAGNKVEFIYFGTGETLGSQYDLKTIKMKNNSQEREISFTYTLGEDYESSHNLVKLIDSENNTYVENTYDENDRVASQIYGNGTIYYDYTLDSNNKVTKNSVTDREGHIIEYFYDNYGNTIKKIVKKSSGDLEYNYVYDAKNNLIADIKPLGNGIAYVYDQNNNVIESRYKQNMSASGSSSDIVSTATYNLTFNKPTQTIGANGLITNYTYDTYGNILSKETLGVKDYLGTDIAIIESFEYNSKGQLTKQINPRGLETTFTYGSGNILKITKGSGATAIENNFEYDTKGNMVKSIDGKGKETLLSYDEFNLVIEKLTPNNTKTNITYNNLNKKTHEEIILGASESVTAEYEYDILDNITQVIQDIDTSKTLTSSKVYDTNSRVIEEQTGSGAKILYTYDENGLIIQKTIQSGGTLGNIITNYAYDNNSRLISETSPKAKVTTYEYDGFDRIIQKTLPNGSYERYTYDKIGNIIKVEIFDENDVLLSKEENIYDKRGKVLENKQHILSNSSHISLFSMYDENGNIIKTIDGNGTQTLFTYDIFDRVLETQDNLGNKIVNTYDKNNNIISKSIVQSNSKTTTTSYIYDDENRLLSETNHLNKVKSYTYNKLNQVISITDEEGNITNFTYNYAGKVLSETKISNSGNIVTSYTYDERGNNISVTDGEGNTTYYMYDNLNRLIKQIYPDSKEVIYVYDKVGNLVSKTDPNGSVITSTYDDMERLISKNIVTGSGVGGVTSENYSYDSLGRLISSTDSNNHTVSFSYDSLNRLVNETQSGSVVSYTYDNNNNLLSINNGNGKITSYIYDDLNRVIEIKLGNDTIAEYSYSGLENTSIDYGNSKEITKTYDALMRITSLNNGVKNYSYSYDDVSNIVSDSYKNYTFDDLYRLTEVKQNTSLDVLENFSYDKVGNRINSFNTNIGSGANYEYSTNNLNQYTTLSGSISRYMIEEILEEIQGASQNIQSEDEVLGEEILNEEETENGTGEILGENENFDETGSGNILDEETGSGENIESIETQEIFEEIPQTIQNITYSGGLVDIDDSKTFVYDNNGNIISNGTYNFIYDYKNRIIEVNNGSGIIAEFAYDVLDRRYFKETGSKTISYVFAGENILGETTLDGVNSFQKDYINGLGTDNLVAYELDNVRYYFHKNHLGSIDGITDNSGDIVIEYEYDSFGNTYVVESGELIDISEYSGDTFQNERLYTGREFDFEIGLYYNRARYYSPELGRFISRDPIDIADDINLYAYVGNNPVMFVDLMGLKAKDAFVEAYDNYLAIEKLIYNFGVFDVRYLMLDSNLRESLKIQYDEAESKAKKLHYARNDYNTNLPSSIEEARNQGWIEPTLLGSKYAAAFYHQDPEIKGNELKFVSPDGHKEIIFTQTGDIVNSDKYMGTYNFFNPSGTIDDKYLHSKYDISPYSKWGNK